MQMSSTTRIPPRRIVASPPATPYDKVIVFLTSFIFAGTMVAPPVFGIYKVVKHLLNARRKSFAASSLPPTPHQEEVETEPEMVHKFTTNTTNSGTDNQTFLFSEASEARRLEEEDALKQRRRLLIAAATAVATTISIYAYWVSNTRASTKTRHWFKNLPIWASWRRYFRFEVLDDSLYSPSLVLPSSQKVVALIPHGLLPYGLAMAAISPEAEREAWGSFRVVAATATKLCPPLAYFIRNIGGVDASRTCVDAALLAGESVAVAPGGIGEMFVGYPKFGCSPNEEVALLSDRKGFIRLCIKHGIPAIPVYVFGASKSMKRLEIPGLELLSKMFRASLVVMFGRFGTPMPFPQKLTYVMGTPIFPKSRKTKGLVNLVSEAATDEMHGRFCEELIRVFESNKGDYSWDHKTLKIA